MKDKDEITGSKEAKGDVIEGRNTAEELLNRVAKMREKGVSNAEEPLHLPDGIIKAWQSVNDLPNDLAHCGFRKQPRPGNKILNAVKALPTQLEAVALDLNSHNIVRAISTIF